MTVAIKASTLGSSTWLADGSLIIHLSFQRNWIYARVITTAGHVRTRRYRYDQMVKVEPTPTDTI